MKDITLQMVELEKASRRSAFLGGFGLTVVAISLVVSTWMLHRSTTQVTLKAHELRALQAELESERELLANAEDRRKQVQLTVENLNSDIKTKTDELTLATERLNAVQQIVATAGPPALVKRVQSVAPYFPPLERPAVALDAAAVVQLSATPTKERLGTRSLYDVRLWIELPKEWIGNILKVQYFFDDPSFSPKLKTSFDRSNHFEIRYKGWGCVDTVKVTIFERSGAQSEVPFKMCSAPGWQGLAEPPSSQGRRGATPGDDD